MGMAGFGSGSSNGSGGDGGKSNRIIGGNLAQEVRMRGNGTGGKKEGGWMDGCRWISYCQHGRRNQGKEKKVDRHSTMRARNKRKQSMEMENGRGATVRPGGGRNG